MKKLLPILLFSIVLMTVSCKKDTDNKEDTVQTPLVFTSLVAVDTLIAVNQKTKLIATATGDELVYTWDIVAGGITGSGAEVWYSVCHASTFPVVCTVTDRYNQSLSKTINITVY
jgi:hypothetical protein